MTKVLFNTTSVFFLALLIGVSRLFAHNTSSGAMLLIEPVLYVVFGMAMGHLLANLPRQKSRRGVEFVPAGKLRSLKRKQTDDE